MQPEQDDLGEEQHQGATIRSLREDERAACLDLWCTVWPGENSPAYFRRYFYGDIDWLPYYTQIAEIDGQIVSAVHICRRVVACGDLKLTMGGIANVATAPAFRGKGYSTACLRRAIAVMEADALDFSLLFTGINAFYAREGFVDWPRERRRGAIRTDFTPRPTTLQVRHTTDADIEAIQQIYAAYNRTRPIAVQRSGAYWRAWIGFAPAGSGWHPVKAVGGYKLVLFRHHDELEVVLPVYKHSDPNCCPTGGFERAYYRFDGKRLVVTELTHTKTFTRP